MVQTTTQTKPKFEWCGFRTRVARGLARRPRVDPIRWCEKNVRFPVGNESEYFDLQKAPHVRGVFERFWNDPTKKKANLIWGTRCMKTSTLIAFIALTACTDPCPMGALAPDGESLANWLDDQCFPMLELNPETKHQIPGPTKRNKRSIRFASCKLRLANGSAKNTVSGWPARKMFKFEHDKNPIRKSREADSSLRADSRTGGFSYDVKILEESSPEDAETSRGWKLKEDPYVLQLEYYVPCPHCDHHQVLNFDFVQWKGRKKKTGSPALAKRTAYYQCCNCGQAIHDHHRTKMMQSGHWMAKGEYVEDGEVRGTPDVESDTVVFHLSRLYSLLVDSWGEFAKEHVHAKNRAATGDIEPLRKWMTEGLAIAWDPQPIQISLTELQTLLYSGIERAKIPDWGLFATRAFDVQTAGNTLTFPWSVGAWGMGGRGQLIDNGIAKSWEECDQLMRRDPYPHADGGAAIAPSWTAMDSGVYPSQVYAFARKYSRLLPCRGGSSAMAPSFKLGEWVGGTKESEFKAGTSERQKLLLGAIYLLIVNSDQSQRWIQDVIEGHLQGKDNEFTMSKDLANDVALLEELTNETCKWSFDRNGNRKGVWTHRDKHKPNDNRDLCRYHRTLAMLITDHGSDWYALPTRAELKQAAVNAPAKSTRKPSQRSERWAGRSRGRGRGR